MSEYPIPEDLKHLFRHQEIYVSDRMVRAMKLHMCVGTDLWIAKDVIQRVLQYIKDNPNATKFMDSNGTIRDIK